MQNSYIRYRLIYTMVVCFFSNLLLAQDTSYGITVTLDPLTGMQDKPAPFDQKFTLLMPVDSAWKREDFKQFTIYIGTTRHGQLSIDLAADGKHPQKLMSFNDLAVKKGKNLFGLVKTGKEYNQVAIVLPPLRPGKTYFPTLISYMDKDGLSVLNQVNSLLLAGKTTEAYNLYSNSIYSRFIKLPDGFGQGFTPAGRNDTLYETFFNDSVCPGLKACVNDSDGKVKKVAGSFERLIDSPNLFRSVLGRMACCHCNTNPLFADKAGILKSTVVINNFLDPDFKNHTVEFAQGLALLSKPLASSKDDGANISDIAKRLLNTQSNEQDVRDIISLIDMLLIITDDGCGPKNEDLKSTKKMLTDLLSDYTGAEKTLKGYVSYLTRLYRNPANGFVITRMFYGNNYGADIKTTAGNYLQPDIGLALMVPVDKDVQSKPLLRPYFGVNLDIFGPINKQTNFRFLTNHGWRETLRHYISMNFGFTAMPLAADNRTDVKDLFNKFSFVNGLCVRPLNLMRFCVGYVLYKKYEATPFTSNGKVSAMPFVSFNIDLDVWNTTQWSGKLF